MYAAPVIGGALILLASAAGLGKAIALEHDLPVIAVPTTYAGSECTPIWGITEQQRKTTGRSLRVLPRIVVYDPELTLELPRDVSVGTALNALAHSAEALYHPAAGFWRRLAAVRTPMIAAGLRANEFLP